MRKLFVAPDYNVEPYDRTNAVVAPFDGKSGSVFMTVSVAVSFVALDAGAGLVPYAPRATREAPKAPAGVGVT